MLLAFVILYQQAENHILQPLIYGRTVQLSALAFPSTGAVYAHVKSVRDMFYLDRTSTLVADGITIVTALGGTGRWLRMMFADPTWYAVTAWSIDPAGTFGTPGNDHRVAPHRRAHAHEHDVAGVERGLHAAPAHREQGSHAAPGGSGPTIKMLSSSTNTDDGFIYGFETPDLLTYVRVFGVPTTIGVSGTVAGYQAYSGNLRGQFTDSAIPTSWRRRRSVVSSVAPGPATSIRLAGFRSR